MERDRIVEKVNRAVLAEFDVEEDALVPAARLGDDLGLDSLDGIDLVVAVERAFREQGVKIAEADMVKLQAMQDIYDYVEARLSPAS